MSRLLLSCLMKTRFTYEYCEKFERTCNTGLEKLFKDDLKQSIVFWDALMIHHQWIWLNQSWLHSGLRWMKIDWMGCPCPLSMISSGWRSAGWSSLDSLILILLLSWFWVCFLICRTDCKIGFLWCLPVGYVALNSVLFSEGLMPHSSSMPQGI